MEYKSGKIVQVDWAGQTVALVYTNISERIETYQFGAELPYSDYTYIETFLGEGLDQRPC